MGTIVLIFSCNEEHGNTLLKNRISCVYKKLREHLLNSYLVNFPHFSPCFYEACFDICYIKCLFDFKMEKEINKGKDIVPIGKTKEQHTVSCKSCSKVFNFIFFNTFVTEVA